MIGGFRLPYVSRSVRITGLLLLGLLLIGCSSSRNASTTGRASAPALTPEETEQRLRSAADRWRGVPYKYGGTTQRGVDCSALVRAVYKTSFQVPLPRSTNQQADVGSRIARSALRPGDLVFFQTGWKQDHVGIYLSDGKFLHASTSAGVTVSRLDRSYWREHWWQARRLLNPAGDTRAARSDSLDRDGTSNTFGW